MSRNPHFYAVKGVDTPISVSQPKVVAELRERVHFNVPMVLGFVVFNVFCAAILLLYFSTEPLFALEPPLWVVQRKRDLYERNDICMETQRKQFEEFGMRPIHAIATPMNTTLWLKCFECLHPDDAEELEDVWKPSPSIIGRKIQNFLAKIREKLIRSQLKSGVGKIERGDLAKYRWERLDVKKKKWTNALRQYDKEGGRDNESAVINFIEEVMSKEDENMKNLFIGDHLELEMRHIDWTKSGWYRCVSRTTKGNKMEMNISQMYYVDILNTFRPIMYNVADDKPKEVDEADFSNRTINKKPKVELYWHRSEWTPCNKCGDRVGERRRTKSCYLKRKWNVTDNVTAPYAVFSVFGKLPCHSTLIPDELKSQLSQNLTFYEEFTKCKKPCTPAKQDNDRVRKVTINETGREEVLDVLPAGEFSTNERLPPLAPPIIRRTIFATESDWLMMDCSNQDATALIWRKDFVEMNGTRIVSWEDGRERQRRVLTSRGIFMIQSARLEDAGLYSCTAYPSGHILRTFRVFIDIGDRSAEVLAAMSILGFDE
uniref:Ig-like domain-containing protein n=1 Tax=Globodera rostochiensis TaxID=31243 RepID=A0A914I477_GLORO